MKHPQTLLGLLGGSLAAKDTGIAVPCWKERDDSSLPRHSFSYLFSPIPRVGVSCPANETAVILSGRATDPTHRAQMVQEQQSLADGHVCGQHLFPNRIPQQERSQDVWLPDYFPSLQSINPMVILRNARGDIEVSLFLWPNFSTPDSS